MTSFPTWSLQGLQISLFCRLLMIWRERVSSSLASWRAFSHQTFSAFYALLIFYEGTACVTFLLQRSRFFPETFICTCHNRAAATFRALGFAKKCNRLVERFQKQKIEKSILLHYVPAKTSESCRLNHSGKYGQVSIPSCRDSKTFCVSSTSLFPRESSLDL